MKIITYLMLLITIQLKADLNLLEFSVTEKTGQLLMVHFHGEIASEDAKTLVQDVHVGGFIYFNWANALSSLEQVKNLSESLQALNKSDWPLLIAVDQEGGRVNRLKEGFTHFPSSAVVSCSNEPHLAYKMGLAIAHELLYAGINMNLAPVVDINSNPKNPVIGDRSFGDSPKKVILYAGQILKGFKDGGLLSVIKHYPGHGDVEIDSHKDLPIVNKSLNELEKQELVPFVTLCPDSDLVMTAHILVPAFDEKMPTTLSKPTLDYLKETIGFKGAIISDSLVMEGLLKSCPCIAEAAIQAINAGCDILLLGGKQLNGQKDGFELNTGDIKKIHKALVEAVYSGRIEEKRLDEAFSKVIALKQKINTRPQEPFDQIKHLKLAEKIAESAKTQ